MITRNMSYRPKFLDRFSMMLEDGQLDRLSSFRILVVGVGGVGSALVHMLARSGVRNIGIMDFDKIDITNINRQLVADHTTIGECKVDALEKQLLNINHDIKLTKYNIKLSADNILELDIGKYDYIVDCIDDIAAKKVLIKYAYEHNIPILSAMGAGNRYIGIPNFEISDISKTSYDPIAKIIRKYCATEGIKKLNVCYTKQKALKFDCQTIGSVVYYVVNMSSIMCAKILNDILI